MSRRIVFAALFVVSVAAGFAFAVAPCEAGYCPSYRCYSSCYQGCLCISKPGESGGNCYGVQQAERLIAAGAHELP